MKFNLILLTVLFLTGVSLGQRVDLPYNSIANNLRLEALQQTTYTDSSTQLTKPGAQTLSGQRKSPGRAFLYSMILPGSGELYTGHKNRAIFFFGIELLSWGGLIGNKLYAGHLENEYKTYATQHARVNAAGKDKQYWIDIGKFDNIYQFNDKRERDRFFDRIYEDESFYYWQWDSKENRYTYDAKRIHTSDIKNRDIYFVGALVLNRLVSAVHSMAMARKHNRLLAEKMSWNLQFDSQGLGAKRAWFKVNFSARF